MKSGFNKLVLAILLVTVPLPAFAVGTAIAMYIAGVSTVGALSAGYVALAFAINMIVATVVSKAFFNPSQPDSGVAGQSPNPGNRQQLPPATDNKLPVVYGTAWLGGSVVDLSITQNNQNLYYVLALCEVTSNGTDTITFGDTYYGGKKVIFQSNGYVVSGLLDESTGVVDTTVSGKIAFYFYRNGYDTPTNQTKMPKKLCNLPGLYTLGIQANYIQIVRL